MEIIRCVRERASVVLRRDRPLGDAASIRMGGVEAVLISTRAQGMGIDLFSNLGIDPKQRKILVVKSNQHFYASFSQIAAQVLYAEGDGPLPRALRKLPWTKVQRPIWPLDARDGTAADHLTRLRAARGLICARLATGGQDNDNTRRNVLKGGLAAAALTSAPSIIKAQAQPAAARTVKAVMHADLRVLDPIWTTANITAYHGAHDLRHAVRPRRELRAAAADGRQMGRLGRQAHLHVRAARRPEMLRRHGGDGGRLRRLGAPLGGARRRRPAP